MNRLLSFKENIYKEAFYKNIMDNVKTEFGFSKVKGIFISLRDILINYFPFIGHLPVSFQLFLKNNFKPIFGNLDVQTATLASAVVSFILAVVIILGLDGFDVGFTDEVRKGWWSTFKVYKSYIGELFPFLGYKYGFPKIYTQVLGWYLVVSSTLRVWFYFLGRPTGSFLAEIPILVMNKLSERSVFRFKAQKIVETNQNLSETIDSFIERDRREKESDLADNTWKFLKEKGSL